jgi:hypothetical protein
MVENEMYAGAVCMRSTSVLAVPSALLVLLVGDAT